MQQVKSIVGPVAAQIRQKLVEKFKPSHLDIINESSMHSVPKNSETHFKVIVVSDLFKGITLLEKHKSVLECLDWELQNGVHALSIVAKTEDDWKKNQTIRKSPACLGGSKLDKQNE